VLDVKMLRQGCRRLAVISFLNGKAKLNPATPLASQLRAFSAEAPKSEGSSWVWPVLGLGAVGGGLWYANANGYLGSSQVYEIQPSIFWKS
jgi:hypothetical protein